MTSLSRSRYFEGLDSCGSEDLPAQKEPQETWFDPWVGKIPWRRAWQPTPAVLPGESHGQRRLEGYSPEGRKESDKTEAT